MTPPRDRHEPGTPPFFFFDLEESFLLRVWIPSFFMVSGRFTCEQKKICLEASLSRSSGCKMRDIENSMLKRVFRHTSWEVTQAGGSCVLTNFTIYTVH
jgi:hypothetical protein